MRMTRVLDSDTPVSLALNNCACGKNHAHLRECCPWVRLRDAVGNDCQKYVRQFLSLCLTQV